MSGTAILTADALVAGYGEMQILHGVSLELAAGEIVTVIGPNGCGKSTLLKTLAGLLRPQGGRIELNGLDITNATTRDRLRAGLGYVPQVRNVFGTMSVEENLRMGLFAVPGSIKDRQNSVREILPTLAEYWTATAGKLSGGQQQVVALGRALMASPTVLLLDEPSAGLSPKATSEVFHHIREISNRQGVAVLLVEQNAHKALEISDRCYILAEGRNQIDGTARSILNNPVVGKIYLGAYGEVE
ncbi:ABC transporter ATP-binding protein [Mesorhizobium hawassense]|uniref:ABC transporter ATP-binding protein n=1 Tax=Mesorhizobium hawassense TaxID=1209954 RepID=A0A330HAM9_9HYPH|nr:ABC transporter ATP-binding protein [Mesorhizobium hawassense]RAZ84778.1 ABC transporter ATP-binding protein [Mesorhizobium hawassense]